MISRALSMLSALAVIDTPLDPRPRTEDFAKHAEALLGTKAERIRALVRNRLLNWVDRRQLNPCFRLLTIIAELGGRAQLTDTLILKSINSDLVNETASGIEQAKKSGLLENLAGRERAAAVCYIFETTRALLTCGETQIRAAFAEPPPDCAAFPVLKARILTNLSACHLGLRDNNAALETVKDAILLSQGKYNLCLPQSYRLFSLVNLSKQQTGETIDYLGFAMDCAEKSGSFHELGISAYYAAAAQFLFGNVSRAALLARKAREQSLSGGHSDWADRACFLEGRLAFETGRYQEALEIFEKLREEPFDGISEEKERLLAAWAYRAKVYFQNPLCPKPESGGHDADLFEVEAAYLAGDFRKTAELSGALNNPHAEENFLYTEQPDWRSGFAQCEQLYFSHGELWDRMICVYHSLALCRLSASGGEEAMHNMQRILRNERLSEMDPWDAFYFYAWYRILEQSGAGQVDMNTAVSIAFKRLQRRASRIDDIETRRQYLSQPRWNSALSLAAKEFKLI
jgi:tetratricopeptide (TPR) repeat protein